MVQGGHLQDSNIDFDKQGFHLDRVWHFPKIKFSNCTEWNLLSGSTGMKAGSWPWPAIKQLCAAGKITSPLFALNYLTKEIELDPSGLSTFGNPWAPLTEVSNLETLVCREHPSSCAWECRNVKEARRMWSLPLCWGRNNTQRPR
jgi:hypothetical protein